MTTEPFTLSASRLAAKIAAREITAVAAVESVLGQIQRAQPTLNAFALVSADTALMEAQAADDSVLSGAQLGALHGVPFSVKDLLDVNIVGSGTVEYSGTPFVLQSVFGSGVVGRRMP